MRFWIFRGVALVFFTAALIQWISYGFFDTDTNGSGMFATISGWIWTIIIALPGCFLWVSAGQKPTKDS